MVVEHQSAHSAGSKEQDTKRSVTGRIIIIALAEINGFDSVFRVRGFTDARERTLICVPESNASQRKASLDQNAKLLAGRLLPIKEEHVPTEFIKGLLLDAILLQRDSMPARLMGEAAHHQRNPFKC